jgi:crossover junction endodeoxyribonuclease RuvC
MPETEKDIQELFSLIHPLICFCSIEHIHAMPQRTGLRDGVEVKMGQGNLGSFKQGYNFGFLIGMLAAFEIPYELVSPQKWQKAMNCLTHGDKNVSKAMAQRTWPKTKFTLKTADACLIGEYSRRKWGALKSPLSGETSWDDI